MKISQSPEPETEIAIKTLHDFLLFYCLYNQYEFQGDCFAPGVITGNAPECYEDALKLLQMNPGDPCITSVIQTYTTSEVQMNWGDGRLVCAIQEVNNFDIPDIDIYILLIEKCAVDLECQGEILSVIYDLGKYFSGIEITLTHLEWIFDENSPNNLAMTLELLEFLEENGEDPADLEFAVLGLDILMEDGLVDFAMKILIDASFKENECLMNVYEQMQGAPTFNNYLQQFDGEFSVAHLLLRVEYPFGLPSNAWTSQPKDYVITITFNGTNLFRPPLSVARTMMHEMIHAEIFRKLLSVAQNPNIDLSQEFIESLKDDYPGLYDYYMRHHYSLPAGVPSGGPQHEAMASHYRDIIVDAIKEFDDSFDEEIYQALAWTGLHGTIAWENLTNEERAAIVQIRNQFKNNHPICQ